MDVAIPVPEDQPGPANILRTVAAQGCIGAPDDHLLGGEAQAVAGVAAQVLVGKEKDLIPDREPQARAAPALLEVQTTPPWRPQKALRSASEFM